MVCILRVQETYGRIARKLSLFVVPAELWLWEEFGPAPLGRAGVGVFLASAITTNRRAPDEVLFRLHQDSRIEQDNQLVPLFSLFPLFPL